MDRYQKVEKPKPESPINENEIRITSQGLVRNYISYATSLLQEKHDKEIVLKAMGQAISKTVAIAEIIKRRVPRLHQDTAISSVSITDVWEPIEEGLLPVEQTRHVSIISITLSTKELNKNAPGYQAPSEEARQYNYQQQIQPPRQARVYNAGNEDSYGRDRGRGRGRGRGWSRGGYANYQENGGYSNWEQDGGRGGGYGGGRGSSYGGSRGSSYGGGRGGSYGGGRGGSYGGGRGGSYDGGRSGGRDGGYDGGRDGDYDGGHVSDYGGGRGGGYGGYRGAGYGRGRGGGGRGYGGRGRGGRMAPAPRYGGNPA